MQIQFDTITLNVRPHAVHEWALTTAEVAAGYGVDEGNIRYHKSIHADELTEGKHFVSVRNPNAVGNQESTYWTKKGVVRLGFFIKSEQAKRFRDWAEDLIITAAQAPTLPKTYKEALVHLIAQVEENERLQIENEALKPDAIYAQAVLKSETELTTTMIAQDFGKSAIWLNRQLHALGIQFKQRGTWILKAVFAEKHYAHLKTVPYLNSQGEAKAKHYLVWTEQGRQFIHQKLNPQFAIVTNAALQNAIA